MLASQITNLTGSREVLVASRDLTTLVRVQMSQSGIAVSIGRDWLVVNMVGEGASLTLEALEVDIDNNTRAIPASSEVDFSGHGAVDEFGLIAI